MSEQCEPFVIREDDLNVSVAWARALLAAVNPRRDLIPLFIRVGKFNGGEPCEDRTVRELLDKTLAKLGRQSCHTVANTIFPQSFWNREKDQTTLYRRYKNVLPRLKAVESRNCRGLYFERLIGFEQNQGDDTDDNKSNQLEHIIRTYLEKTRRRTVLQAAIFDPRRDHTEGPYLKFPCLQHVTFVPCGKCGMAVNGFYAMQYLFERAYGNYLGLCRLGNFVAHELGLELVQMNCMIGIGKVDVKSSDIRGLTSGLENRLAKIQ
ncbi:MAG: thymidylate synthase [Planctomycetes bacterium B3_Pla]|nr:MAG: thymidylate synthase [Planctomycetes bacterium B3_Pla]